MNRFAPFLLVVVAPLALAACSEFEVKNKAPIAVATALVNGAEVDVSKPVDYNGAPVAVTLSATKSSDPDGSIKRYLWLRTDVPSAQRYMLDPDAGAAPPDPAPGPQATVMLELGTHRFTLWVTDNEGKVSKPASIKLEVKVASNFMPDATCMADYPNPNATCAECVCSPMANMGCLELYNNCYKNPDPEFARLCGAVITCAIAGKCVGSACYAPAPLCMTQITEAGMYMGGTVANCSMGEMGSNPCRGANLLGACTNYDAMMLNGPCRTSCM